MLKIEAKDFRSYPSLSWSLPDGLTLIDGANKDTGGSNMSGKTTLLDAWFWARYAWLPKWGGPKGGSVEAVVRRGCKSCYVDVVETFGPDEIRYRRERPNRLTVWKNGVEQKGMDQTQFITLLGMTDMRFLICVYIPQKRKQSFYHMGDKERTEMLSIIAGLEELDGGLGDAKIRRDNAKQNIERLDGAKAILEAQLAEFPVKKRTLEEAVSEKFDALEQWNLSLANAKIAYEERKLELQREETAKLAQETGSLDGDLRALGARLGDLSTEYRELETKIKEAPDVEPELTKAVQKQKLRVRNAKDHNDRVESVKKNNQKLRDKAKREEELADSALHGKCQSCSQPLPDWDVNAKVKSHQQAANDYLKQQEFEIDPIDLALVEKDLEEANLAYMKRKMEIEALPSQIRMEMSKIDSQIKQTQSERRVIESKKKEIETRLAQETKDKITELRRDVSYNEKQSEIAEMDYGHACGALDSLVGSEQGVSNQLHNTGVLLKNWREELDLSLDLIDLYGPKGYRAVCFDGLVNRIGDRAGELLQIMTDGLYTTRLEQIGQDSKGNQKIILKPVVRKGSQEVSLDDLSGGADDRIALAYDVAVSDAAGDGLPLLLDEVLKGIDEVGKAEAMILLEEVSKTRPVLVIDHTSEFKAMFSQVIKVVYENEESRIEANELDPATYNVTHG